MLLVSKSRKQTEINLDFLAAKDSFWRADIVGGNPSQDSLDISRSGILN